MVQQFCIQVCCDPVPWAMHYESQYTKERCSMSCAQNLSKRPMHRVPWLICKNRGARWSRGIPARSSLAASVSRQPSFAWVPGPLATQRAMLRSASPSRRGHGNHFWRKPSWPLRARVARVCCCARTCCTRSVAISIYVKCHEFLHLLIDVGCHDMLTCGLLSSLCAISGSMCVTVL